MNIKDLIDHINTYESAYSPWLNRTEKIEKRYEDERSANNKKSKFNILWSNVQTLSPALYDRHPNPNIERRNLDNDDLGRQVSEILERSASYFVKEDAFDEIMRQTVLDRLLGGRGTSWVRYVPSFGVISQVTSDAPQEPESEVYGEDVVVDHVNVRDFGHNVARTWAEVTLVWRKAYLDRKELIKRFPKYGEQITLDAKPLGSKVSRDEVAKKATIYEMWDKDTKTVYWIHKDFPNILDQKNDPLKLKDFFPCPKPLYATLTNNSLVPVPDYVQYQDQAVELDNLTARASILTQALRVAGVYDASAEGLQKLLSENIENKLVPVDQWGMFAEKGGLKGVIDFFPIDQVAAVLQGVYIARDKVKQDIYELTGISDIIRGASNPNETLGAQELKGKYAGLRLGEMQKDVARFSRALVAMITEIIAEHFDLDTIKALSGVKLLTEAQKMELQASMARYQQLSAQAQQMQQPPPPPPADEDTLDLLKEPSWEDVDRVIRQDMPRCFIIDIETDSTIKVDQDAEKAARTEFLTAVSTFLQASATIQIPEMKPLLMEMLMFGVRGFKAGRELESVFQNTMDKMKKADEQPQQPNPEAALKAKELDLKDKELSQKTAILEKESDIKGKELLLKDKQINADFAKHEMTTKAESVKARMDAKTKVSEEVALSDPDLNDGVPPMGVIIDAITQAFQIQSENLARSLEQIALMNAQSNQAVIEAITKPKVTRVIRDPKTKELLGSEQHTA